MKEDLIKDDLKENLQRLIFKYQRIYVKRPFFIRVYVREGYFYDYLLTKDEVISVERSLEGSLKDHPLVQVDYKALKKILEKPSRALRYFLQGKIRGDIGDFIKF